MNTLVTTEFSPHVSVINGEIKTTSLKVSEHFGKIHRNVVRDIENLQCSDDFRLLNFEQSSYGVQTPNGGRRKHKMYEMTKDGFMFLVMGFTGSEAARWKEAYIKAFNEMELQLLGIKTNIPNLDKQTLTTDMTAAINRRARELTSGKYEYYRHRLAKEARVRKYEMEFDDDHVLMMIEKEQFDQEPRPKDCLDINLDTKLGQQTISLKFESETRHMHRWTVTYDLGTFTIRPMGADVIAGSIPQLVRLLQTEYGYVVVKKNEVLKKLGS